MMGKMTPPILDPLDMIPYAVPRFLANHPGITLVASVMMLVTVLHGYPRERDLGVAYQVGK